MVKSGPNIPPKALKDICHRTWGPLKGEAPASYTKAEIQETLEWLRSYIKDLSSQQTDDIVLAERGLSPMIDKDERRIKRERDYFRACWALVCVLRRTYTVPIRLEEGVDECEILIKNWQAEHKGDLTGNPLLSLYYAAALDRKFGGSRGDPDIVDLLSPLDWKVIGQHPTGQPGHAILGWTTLSKALRRLGRLDEAEKYEKQAVDQATQSIPPSSLIPWITRAEILGPNETEPDSPVMRRIGTAFWELFTVIPPEQIVPGTGVPFSYKHPAMPPPGLMMMVLPPPATKPDLCDRPVSLLAPPEVDKGERRECWVSGCRAEDELKNCGHCTRALYCTTEHQKTAWRLHKTTCRQV